MSRGSRGSYDSLDHVDVKKTAYWIKGFVSIVIQQKLTKMARL